MEKKDTNDLMNRLSHSFLYLLTPPDIIDPDLLIPRVVMCVRAGADIIQFRNKMVSANTRDLIEVGKMLCEAVHKEGALFIVNDRIDIAMAVNADGVHLGQEDLPLPLARQIIGKTRDSMIIGLSSHSHDQVLRAESEGADYIGFGPIFPTLAKSGYPTLGTGFFHLLNKTIGIPYFAIGGINSENIDLVLEAGASRVAVCSGVFGEEDLAGKTRLIKNKPQPKHKANREK